jgi:hypothetical protein
MMYILLSVMDPSLCDLLPQSALPSLALAQIWHENEFGTDLA